MVVDSDAVIVMLAVPSNETPLIVLAVANFVAVVAVVAVVALPLKLAVIVPALKFPLASLATTFEAVFADVASTAKVPDVVIVPPVKYEPPATLVTVPVVELVPAPIAVLKVAASSALTVLSALNLGNVIADGFVKVNIFPPTVVAPNDVLPVAAVNPVAPPSHLFLSVYAVSQFVCEVVVGIEYPLVKVNARVPLDVIGEPVTASPVGVLIATEVTVPVLAVAPVAMPLSLVLSSPLIKPAFPAATTKGIVALVPSELVTIPFVVEAV